MFNGRYTDETGVSRNISISDWESREALKNDYNEILRSYNPEYVQIRRLKAQPGEALRILVEVTAPSHYLKDGIPHECNRMSVCIVAKPGYPLEPVTAMYLPEFPLASVNAGSSGWACIDGWTPMRSSIVTVVDKLVRDIIHDPSVTKYNSPANSGLIGWHKNGVREGRFPTIDPKLLYLHSSSDSNDSMQSGENTSNRSIPARRERNVGISSSLPPRRESNSMDSRTLPPRRENHAANPSSLPPRRGNRFADNSLPPRRY